MRPIISIVIPAFNEAHAILDVIGKIQRILDQENLKAEIIIVDDGSTDETAAIVAKTTCRLIRHPYNKGYGASLKTGIRQAKNDIILITDADGTYPPEAIPRLVKEMGPHDMVVGARTGASVHIPLLRRPVKWVLTKLANYLSGISIPDLNSGLRIFRREIVLRYFRLLPSGFSFTTTITLAMLTNDYNVLYIPIDYHKRTGKSKIQPIQDTVNFFSLVFRMVLSFRPLRVFVPLLALFGLTSFAKVLYDFKAYDFHLAASTVVLLTLTFQLAVLGLIADLIVSLHKTE